MAPVATRPVFPAGERGLVTPVLAVRGHGSVVWLRCTRTDPSFHPLGDNRALLFANRVGVRSQMALALANAACNPPVRASVTTDLQADGVNLFFFEPRPTRRRRSCSLQQKSPDPAMSTQDLVLHAPLVLGQAAA